MNLSFNASFGDENKRKSDIDAELRLGSQITIISARVCTKEPTVRHTKGSAVSRIVKHLVLLPCLFR